MPQARRIAVGSDHRGVEVKNRAARLLASWGWQVEDAGCDGSEPVDYPDVAERVSRMVADGRAERGVLVCGTGIGMSIAANKIAGIRAALVGDAAAAKLARQHNDANVLVLASRTRPEELAEILRAFLNTPFEGGRHQRRVDKIRRLERSGEESGE
ncbi:MAG: ribose 5-phosphate isomerase B [Candidatus Dadabacteria bacterium]|nr:MAG: ribose 5-phosphate isomerase B [Candidatus Dadabacteria bacterium]